MNLSYETWEQVFDGNDVNEIFNSFLNTFLRIYYSSFPLIRARKKLNQNSWITPGIITSCKRKRELYKELKNNNNTTLASYYRQLYCIYFPKFHIQYCIVLYLFPKIPYTGMYPMDVGIVNKLAHKPYT